MKFCGKCRTALGLTCPNCSFENPPGFDFCGQCAAALHGDTGITKGKAAAAKLATTVRVVAEDASATLEGERKTVTALFADIKGSTELMEDLDPEEARAIIDPALKLMIDAAHRYDGYVVQSTGDGIFALFGAPVAHEDHPQRALYAALRLQEALREHGQRLTAQGKPAAQARVGINTGEVVLRMIHTGGHTEYTPVGHVANLAARMQSAALAGGIVISEETRRLVEGYFELRDLGSREVKGVSEPINIYEVIGAGAAHGHFQLAERRGLTKFVGREREVAELKRTLELARSGHGQIIAAVAEAGTGKSRLVYEFKAMLPGDCKVLEAYSVSHGKASAYLPVLELLYDYFGIEEADDKAKRRTKIEARISVLDPVLSDTLPLLYSLMGLHEGPDPLAQMDPQIKRRRTLDAIKRIILRESLNQPTVVIFEDLHWIDSETQALLDLLAEGIANARVLMLVNYRPEYRHEWGNKSYYVQLRLDALGPESAGEMLAMLLGDGMELNPLKRLIIERTEGNPFFIEEMVQALFDEGALVRGDPHPGPPRGEGSKGREQHIGAVKVTRSLAQVRLPPTVQGILAARIDRLGPEQKELLQILAVMGRESPLGLIKRVASTGDAPLEQMLSALQAGEFIYEQPSLAGYIFKHALTQEVAYNSLLIERRKPLHERAAGAMELLYADRLDDHLGDLAHHYQRSDNIAKAVEYLGRVGQQAQQRHAYADAVAHLSAAIDLLQKLPDNPERIQRELLLQMALGRALMPARGFAAQEVERAFTRAQELCEQLGDPPQLFRVLYGLWIVHQFRGELRTAQQLGERLLERAQNAQDPVQLLLARQVLGQTFTLMGELLRAREHVELALSLYHPERHRELIAYFGDARVGLLSCLGGLLLWPLGYPDQALKQCYESLVLARAGSAAANDLNEALAHYYIVSIHKSRREATTAQEGAERLIAYCSEYGFTLWLALATTIRGWAIATQGRHAEGIAQIEEGLAAARAIGSEGGIPGVLCWLAEACGAGGRFDEGLSALTEALSAIDEREERFWEAEIHRLKGELLIAQDPSNAARAEKSFRTAIEISRRQSAKSWELAATMSLARLLASQGRREEARGMLAEIYGWFTEGFDTADLKDAKALLDELAN